jgi:PAS domain S-box-containing protein
MRIFRFVTPVHVVAFIGSVSFLALFIVIVRDAALIRDRARASLVFATACLSVVTIIARVQDITGARSVVLSDLIIAGFLASGYGLVLFRDAFIPLTRRVRVAVLLVVAGTAAFDIAVRFPTSPIPHFTRLQMAAIASFGVVYSLMIGESTIRFWRAGRTVPVVQRARLRSISAGYAGIIAVLGATIAVTKPNAHPVVVLLTQFGSVAVVVLLYVGFAPPRWIRRVWREPEEEAFRKAVEQLLLFTPKRADLAERAVEWAVRLVGANGGLILDADGSFLAEAGAGCDELHERVSNRGPSWEPAVFTLSPDNPARAIVIPLHLKSGAGTLAVRSGPFTPLFGSDELTRLAQYAAGIAAALDRVGLVEEVARRNDQYEALLGGISDLGEGFIVLEESDLVYANDAYLRISGFSLEELQSISLVDLTVPEDRDAIVEIGRRRRAGETVPEHYETAMIRKDGRRIDVEVSVKAIDTEGALQVISLIRDVTARKAAERELKRLDEARRAFIANAAHELRTPLTVVSGIAGMLSERRDALRPSQVADSFEALERQVERIRVLIDNLLDLSQIEQGRLAVNLQPVGLRSATERAMEGAPPPAGVRFRVLVDDGVAVVADPNRLDQVLVNFLTNAYRYGGPAVSLEATDAGDAVLVTITDDGPGVPADLVPHLFDPFTRGAEVRRVQGSGLGLAIVRRLVEAFGGDVWYEPVKPHGARFGVRLPRAAA